MIPPNFIGLVTATVLRAAPDIIVSWRHDEIRRLVTVRATVRTDEHSRVYFQRNVSLDDEAEATASVVAEWLVSRIRRVGAA